MYKKFGLKREHPSPDAWDSDFDIDEDELQELINSTSSSNNVASSSNDSRFTASNKRDPIIENFFGKCKVTKRQ